MKAKKEYKKEYTKSILKMDILNAFLAIIKEDGWIKIKTAEKMYRKLSKKIDESKIVNLPF